MSEGAANKSISGAKLLAIFLVIGAIVTFLLVRTYVDMVERINAEKEAELQAEYAAYDAAAAAEDSTTGDEATDAVGAEEGVVEETAPAE